MGPRSTESVPGPGYDDGMAKTARTNDRRTAIVGAVPAKASAKHASAFKKADAQIAAFKSGHAPKSEPPARSK